jgi:putative ABC transport system permease protein
VSYSVRRRTAEFGVRMALGAMPRHVLKLVARQVALQVSIGFMIGGFLAYALGRQLTSQLYQVPAHDGVTLLAVAITLTVAATLASLAPVRRALRVNPVVALRQD